MGIAMICKNARLTLYNYSTTGFLHFPQSRSIQTLYSLLELYESIVFCSLLFPRSNSAGALYLGITSEFVVETRANGGLLSTMVFLEMYFSAGTLFPYPQCLLVL